MKYAVGVCGLRWVGIQGGWNHVPIVGKKKSQQVGDNLAGFCARCPAPKNPHLGKLVPTPPTPWYGGSPLLTLHASSAVAAGVDELRKKCGGCNGPGEAFFYATVKTGFSLTQSKLQQTASQYHVEYECHDPSCPIPHPLGQP